MPFSFVNAPNWYMSPGKLKEGARPNEEGVYAPDAYAEEPGVVPSILQRSKYVHTRKYEPYTGPRVEPLQPSQTEARHMASNVARQTKPRKQHDQVMDKLIKSMKGSSRKSVQGMVDKGIAPIGTAHRNEYVNSVLNNVMNPIQQRMVRDLTEKILPSIDNELIAKGRFLQPGRHTLHERALRNLQETLAHETSLMSHDALMKSDAAIKDERERQLYGARLAGGLESSDLSRHVDAAKQAESSIGDAQQRELTAANQMNVFGEAERTLGQEGLNIRAADFARQQNFPRDMIRSEADIATRMPRAPLSSENVPMPDPSRSVASNLAGAGMMALGAARQPQTGVYKKGGSVKADAQYGRYGDTEIAYIPQSVSDRLDRMIGGPSINPHTGHKEYFLGTLASMALPFLIDLFKPKPQARKPEPEDISYGWGDGQSGQKSVDMKNMRGYGFNTLGDYSKADSQARQAGFNSYDDFDKQYGPKVDRAAEYKAWRSKKDMQNMMTPPAQHQFPNSSPQQSEMLREQGYAHGGRVRYADGGPSIGGMELLNRLVDPGAGTSMAQQMVRQHMGQDMMNQQQPQEMAPPPSLDDQAQSYEQQIASNPLDRGAQSALSSLNKARADRDLRNSANAYKNSPGVDPWGAFLMKMGAKFMGGKNPDTMQRLGEAASEGVDDYTKAVSANQEHARRTAELHKAMQETYRVEELERTRQEASKEQNQASNARGLGQDAETARHNKEMEAIGWGNIEAKADGKAKTVLVPVGGGDASTAQATGQPMIELEKDVDAKEIKELKKDLKAVDATIKNTKIIRDNIGKSGLTGFGWLSNNMPAGLATKIGGNEVSRAATKQASGELLHSTAGRIAGGRMSNYLLASVRDIKPDLGETKKGGTYMADNIESKALSDKIALKADIQMVGWKIPPHIRVQAISDFQENNPTFVDNKIVIPNKSPLDYLPKYMKMHFGIPDDGSQMQQEEQEVPEEISPQAAAPSSDIAAKQQRLAQINAEIAQLQGAPVHDAAYHERLASFDAANRKDEERERNGYG